MKRLLFIAVILLMCCSCANRSNNQQVEVSTNVVDAQTMAIEKLKDTTITSVYLGLKLGVDKDSVVNVLTGLQQQGKISELKPVSLDDDSNYRCTELEYHNDSYRFASTINVKVDSVFYAFETRCVVDFYKNQLYSVVITTYPYDFLKVESEKGWEAIKRMYENNYGIGYTAKSTRESDKLYKPDIWLYLSTIENCLSYTTDNQIWTTSNVQIILANKKATCQVDEYDESSFQGLYRKYERDYGNYIQGLVHRLESEARLIKSSYKERNNYLIVYKDIRLHNEVVKEQQAALEEENRVKAEKARQKAIEDSLRQVQIQKEYENQSI